MRKRRTIYFNDARHYYLWLYEPPMKLQDAWRPIDEVAGTAVDTFSYGVSRSDGLFYPSKVGRMFGEDMIPFTSSYVWRAYECMKSLIDRGLDPLQVLIDRAHDKGMEFIASLRLGEYGGMDPAKSVRNGGRGWVHQEVRDHLLAIYEELATQYSTDALELDFAAAPAGSPRILTKEDAVEYTDVVTEWVRRAADVARNRSGESAEIGARVYPTEALNLDNGVDVRRWLAEGLLDFVVPTVYAHNLLDIDMPIDWLVEAAHEADVSVYPMLMPYYNNEQRHYHTREFATPAMFRAAAANYWDRGADGLYTWFLHWPQRDSERNILTELADPDLVKEGYKHYVVNRNTKYADEVGYARPLPLELPSAELGVRREIPFYIADDIVGAAERIRQVQLRVKTDNLVSADQLTIELNGESLENETCLRPYAGPLNQYNMWLEFHLADVRPKKGRNILTVALEGRPPRLEGSVVIEDVEVIVDYGPYPSGLSSSGAPEPS